MKYLQDIFKQPLWWHLNINEMGLTGLNKTWLLSVLFGMKSGIVWHS